MKRKKNIDKLKLFASLFKHNFKGQQMTYIFIIDSTNNNEIKRARVPIKNGIPEIKGNLNWKKFL